MVVQRALVHRRWTFDTRAPLTAKVSLEKLFFSEVNFKRGKKRKGEVKGWSRDQWGVVGISPTWHGKPEIMDDPGSFVAPIFEGCFEKWIDRSRPRIRPPNWKSGRDLVFGIGSPRFFTYFPFAWLATCLSNILVNYSGVFLDMQPFRAETLNDSFRNSGFLSLLQLMRFCCKQSSATIS